MRKIPNTRGLNHADPPFNFLRPQLITGFGRHCPSYYGGTRVTPLRPNKPHNKQEKTPKRHPNHWLAVFANSHHQSNQHRHQLKQQTGRSIKVTKNLIQATKDQIKDRIIQTVKKEEPETAKQLISLIQQTQGLPEREIAELLVELENENKIHFTKKEPPTPATVKEYVFSSNAVWYWTTIALAAVTTVAVFTIPENAIPLVYLSSSLGIIFVLFLPGFTFIKALFPAKVPVKTSSENMDTIERITLSFGMSLVLVPIVGLILNYTPWGIRLTPITLSLLALTVVFATVAILREYQTKPNPSQVKS